MDTFERKAEEDDGPEVASERWERTPRNVS